MSGSRYRLDRPCAYEGCETIVRCKLGFCPTHYSVAYACGFDTSCRHRCAAHSKTRLCQEHAWYTAKLRREKRRQE